MEKIIVYSKHSCRESDKLKQFLNSKKISYADKDISHDVLLKREMIERSGGRSTTPQVFVSGKLEEDIGKFQEQLVNELKAKSRAA